MRGAEAASPACPPRLPPARRDRPARPQPGAAGHRRGGERPPRSRSGFSGRAAPDLQIRSRLCQPPHPPPPRLLPLPCPEARHGTARTCLSQASRPGRPGAGSSCLQSAPTRTARRGARDSPSSLRSCSSFPLPSAAGLEAAASAPAVRLRGALARRAAHSCGRSGAPVTGMA